MWRVKDKMEKFKVGGKITLEDGISYRILDVVKYNEENYLFCCTETKPIEPKIFICKEKDAEIYVSEEKNKKILLEITKKVINNIK